MSRICSHSYVYILAINIYGLSVSCDHMVHHNHSRRVIYFLCTCER